MDHVQPSLDLFDEHKPYIKGKRIHEIFHNPENLYSVTKIRVLETTEAIEEREMVVVGIYPSLMEGEIYTFWGQMKHHARFGPQYEIEHFRKEVPQGKEGLIHYLSSNLFPGIGPKSASAIAETLGEKAISIILENPEALREVPQLNEKKRKQIYERLLEYQGFEQVMIKLAEYGIGLALSVVIYQEYQEQTMDMLQENPYQLIEDIDGIGFKRADTIAKAMGTRHDSPERMRAACLYFLREQAERNGHVYIPQADFLQGVKEWVNDAGEMTEDATLIDEQMISEQVLEMGEEGKLILEEDRMYLPSLFYAEKGFAKKIKELLSNDRELEWTTSDFLQAMGKLEEKLGMEYSASQKEAIEKALRSSLLILTGGPGTGKTTVIQGVCELFAEIHECSLDPKDYAGKDEPFPVILVAPTGRAAKRMSETTGIPAVTIHRLLGWKGGKEFEHSEDDPIRGRLLIIDESSMMDQWLANQLFRALDEDMQVIFVGDEDQLPSVGPGQVLTDLIKSEQIPVIELTDIYRQARGSSIITLAHQMKNGQIPDDLHDPKPDRRFFPCSAINVVHTIRQVCASAKKKGYTVKDIQVLAPMYKGQAGIDALNEMLQEEFNPRENQKREIQSQENTFRVGDKVLQLVNNPEENVFNGDIGEIISIIYAKENSDKEDQVIVLFDQTEVTYARNDLNQLTLAYCCSVHKSQGSEFPIVVLPVVKSYYRMLKRNLIYTAITRGKEYLILCGEEQAFYDAIKRKVVAERYTSLSETLREWMTGIGKQSYSSFPL